MKNEIYKSKIQSAAVAKWMMCLFGLGLIFFPDVIGHGILWLIHIFYEATSLIFEEILIHHFYLDKALAQLIVFYFSIVVGLVVTILFWRRKLRNYLVFKYNSYKHQTLYFWHCQPTIQKIKIIVFNFFLMASVFMVLLS